MIYNQINKLDTMDRLSESMAEVLRVQNELAKDSFSTVGKSYDEIREDYVKERVFWNEGGPQMHKTTEVEVATQGDKKVSVRLHYPSDKKIYNAIFYIHGGGMVVGNNDTHSRIMRILAKESDSIVIGIDYSLSPEAVYPTAINECVAVYNFFMQNADFYNINTNNVGFAGDSGGANLSLGTVINLRENNEDISNIKALLLYYGAYGITDSISMRQYGGVWDGLTEDDLAFYRGTYLGNTKIEEAPYYNCYLNDLTVNVPPCFIVGCELDPLVDDSKLLFSILCEYNLDCEYMEYKGVIHAFLHYSRIMDSAYDAIKKGGEFFKERTQQLETQNC